MRLLPALLLILPTVFLCLATNVLPLNMVTDPGMKKDANLEARKVNPRWKSCDYAHHPLAVDANVHVKSAKGRERCQPGAFNRVLANDRTVLLKTP